MGMKTFYCVLASVTMFAISIFSASPKLNIDGYATFYSDRSSCAERLPQSNLDEEMDLLFSFFHYEKTKAESVYVSGECDVDGLLKKYAATLQKTEYVDGVTCYYCYSPRLGGGVNLFGKRINLHVAVAQYGYMVGYPFIYGGY